MVGYSNILDCVKIHYVIIDFEVQYYGRGVLARNYSGTTSPDP